MSGRQPKQSLQASRPAASITDAKSNALLKEELLPSNYTDEVTDYSSLVGYILLDLSSQLMAGLAFEVSKVWYKLDIDATEGYFGVYWYCYTSQQKFTVHCTLAKWDVQEWTATSITGYYNEGPNLEKLKKKFDAWVRLPEVSARLLSWKTLNVHECTPVQCRNHHNWRIILQLRQCADRQQLYGFKADFERIYDVRKNQKTRLHYSVDAVCSTDSPWISLDALD